MNKQEAFKSLDPSSSSKLGRSNTQEQGSSKAELRGRISFTKLFCSNWSRETLNIQVAKRQIYVHLFNQSH